LSNIALAQSDWLLAIHRLPIGYLRSIGNSGELVHAGDIAEDRRFW